MESKSDSLVTTEDSDTETLLTIFQEGLDLYNNLGKIDEPTNSPAVQLNVNKAIKILENATRLVSLAGIFSRNEDIEEIPTENLRYLLLPALLGTLCLKLTSGNRKEITEVAEIYYKDFLQRCNDYGLSNYKLQDSNPTEKSSESTSQSSNIDQLRYSVNTRANKIQKFKEQKELKTKLEELKQNLDHEHVDEEVKRKYFLTMIKLYIHEAVDELGGIEAEKQILEHIATLNKDEKPKFKRPQSRPLKPIIITKDAAQRAVFGAGYPSLPVMSVEEFYEKRVQDGIFPDPTKQQSQPMSLIEAAAAGTEFQSDEDVLNEMKVENDDPELLERARQQDEYKDDHRRGWGNRMNRS